MIKVNQIKTVAVLFFMITFYGCSHNRLIKKNYLADVIENNIDEYLLNEDLDFNGSVLIALENRIILRRNYGYIDVNKNVLIENTSKFNIGSICKEFTSMAIFNLIEEGKLSFNMKISEVLDELPKWAEKVEIEDLLFYESGLPNMKFYSSFSDKEVIKDLIKVDNLLFEPGSKFKYSNLNNFLQAKIVEKITQEKLSSYVEDYFFRPLKMNNTVYTSNPPKNEKDITRSYSKEYGDDISNNPNFKHFELCYAPVFMTTVDLYKWIQFIQKKFEEEKNESEKFYKETNEKNIGPLGLIQRDDGYVIKHEHLGQAYNFEALMMRDYENKITIILMTNNRKTNQLTKIKQKILEIIEQNKIKKGALYQPAATLDKKTLIANRIIQKEILLKKK